MYVLCVSLPAPVAGTVKASPIQRSLNDANETHRRRLAVVWVAFAVVMAYVTVADGITTDVGDLVGLLTVALGLALAYVYYANPNGMLDFGT